MKKDSKGKRWSFIKQSTAMFLAIILFIPYNITALADVKLPVTVVEGTRREENPENAEGSRIYFGTSEYTADEKDWIYSFSVFRDGDISEGETAIIHSLDISAQYGKDYEIRGSASEGNGDGRTLLEIAATADQEDMSSLNIEYNPENEEVSIVEETSEHENDAKDALKESDDEIKEETTEELTEETEEVLAESAEEIEEASGEPVEEIKEEVSEEPVDEAKEEVSEEPVDEAKEEVSEEPAEEAKEEVSEETAEKIKEVDTEKKEGSAEEDTEITRPETIAIGTDGKISLAELKQLKTGEEVRVTDSPEAAEFANVISEAVGADLLRSMQYSAELKIRFAPGESEKQISVKILDDDASEGTEMFSMMLVDAEISEIVAPAGLSFTIGDDEEYDPSEISFSDKSYEVKNGSAEITLIRTGQEQSMASAVITASNEITGEETIVGEAVFTPYTDTVTVELDVAKEANLKLTDFAGAEGGEIINAVLLGDTAETGEEDPEADTFYITVNGNEYRVDRAKEDTVSSPIWDERYTPALEVGTYYYPTPEDSGGSFSYYTGGDGASAKYAEYLSDSHCAHMHYYSKTTWNKGYVGVSNKDNSQINPIYYQYILPDWEQTHHRFGGQRSYFIVNEREWYKGADFDRQCTYGGDGGGCAYQIKNEKGNLDLTVEARDVEGNQTPDIEIYLYGFPAMYKYYNVSKENPDSLQYITGLNDDGSYRRANMLPANTAIKCGAQVLGDTNSMNVYANIDENKSNFEVLLSESEGPDNTKEIFGKIKGYKITLPADTPENTVYLDYPEDFFDFLNAKKMSKTDAGNKILDKMINILIEENNTSISKEIEKVKNDYGTVPFDKYFIEWIEKNQKTVYGGTGAAYYQKLKFKPIFDYNDVTVTVLEPAIGEGSGKFLDGNLTAGSTVTRHAGDTMNLAVTDVAAGYRADGYEVSTNGGKTFDVVRRTDNLVLLPNTSYVIRPNIIEGSLCIEVDTDLGSSQIDIQGLVPAEKLIGTEFEGKMILDINPKASDIYQRVAPVVGEVYEIKAIIKSEVTSGGMVQRLVFTDGMTKERFGGDAYFFEARAKTSDNVINITTRSVSESSIKEASISGYACMTSAPIRDDAMGMRTLALSGYQVQFPALQKTESQTYIGTAAGIVYDDGFYTTEPFKVADGEKITAIVGNGLNDTQVFSLTIHENDGTVDGGIFELEYPFNAPEIRLLDYTYDKSTSRNKVDFRDNNIRCFEGDTLTLRAVVNQKGRTVKKLVYTVYHADGVKAFSVDAEPVTGGDTFEAKIEDMTNNLYNGDYFNVYIVDDEKVPDMADLEIRYPSRRTGLKCYVQNELVKPKNLDVAMADQNIWGDVDEPTVDVPLFGPVTTASQSGAMLFKRINWPDGNGYSLMLNFDALIMNSARDYTIGEKLKLKDQYNHVTDNLKSYKEEKKVIAEDVFNSLMNPIDESHTPNPGERESQERALNQSTQALNEIKSKTDQEVQTLNKDAKMNFKVIFCLDLEFVKTPTEYVLAMCTVTIGGTFYVSKTWYSHISFVPVFMNVAGTAQVNVMMGGACPEGKNAVKEGDFDEYSGNIMNQINDKHTFVAEMDVILDLKLSIGAGLAGVLSARGFVSAGVQLSLVTPNMNVEGDRWGTILNTKGGVGFDLLLFSVDFNAVALAWGAGMYEGKSKISFFNDNDTRTSNSNTNLLGSGGDTSIPEVSDEDEDFFTGDITDDIQETVEVGDYTAGGDVADNFLKRKPLKAQLETVDKTILMSDAADRVRPQITKLSDGRGMITFIGRRPGEGDEMCLFYSIREKDGNWGTPTPVCDDKTFDAQSDVITVGSGENEKVVIVWVDASEEIDGMDDYKEQLNSLSISAAVYDVANGIMSEKIKVSGNGINIEDIVIPDDYFDCNPHLSTDGDKVLCTFITRDIDDAENPERLTDLVGLYSTARHSTIDVKTMSATEPDFITVEYHGETKDPLVLDHCTEYYETDSDRIILSAWSVDMDGDYDSAEDRMVYLMFTDRNDGNKTYFPIKVSADDESVTSVKLSKFGNEVYLSWIGENNKISISPLSGIIDNIFHSEKYAGNDSSLNAEFAEISQLFRENATDRYWLRKAENAAVFTEHQGEEDYIRYEDTIYAGLAEGKIPRSTCNMRYENTVSGSISDYRLASDGKHVYIFFTDYTAERDNFGKELFGMAYYDGTEGTKTKISNPVRITDYGLLMDDFDIFMNDKSQAIMITDSMRQEPNEDGEGMIYSDKVLAQLTFIPVGSVVPKENTIDITGGLVPGTKSVISVDVENNGLLDANGADVKFSIIKDGVTTLLGEAECSGIIESGDSRRVAIPWIVPDDISGTQLEITATERDVAAQRSNTIREYLECDEKVLIDDAKALVADGRLTVSGTVINRGNAPSESFTLNLIKEQYGDETEDTLCKDTLSEEGLAPGESRSFEMSYDIEPEDFTDFGQIRFAVEAERGDERIDTFAAVYSSNEPVLAKIDTDGKPFKIKKGSSMNLTTKVAPWEDYAGDAVFVSCDPDIISVSPEGKITANKTGTTEVKVMYPTVGLQDSITITVTSGGGGGEERHSSSSSGITGIMNGPQGAQHMIGNWKKQADGNWKFFNPDGSVFTGWGYTSSSNGWDYYHMRDDGIMDYGWYYDEKLKKWYYLREIQDSRFGAMVRGWHLDIKDGKWYYLDPKTGEMRTGWLFVNGRWYYLSMRSDVPSWIRNEKGEWVYSGIGRALGSMYANEKTPDGYEVDVTGAWKETK